MKIVWTQGEWLIPGLVLLGAVAIGLFLSYRRRTSMPVGIRWLACGLKWVGFALVVLFLLQPERVETFSRPGSNQWAILMDNSASMTLKDQHEALSRGDRLTAIMRPDPTGWRAKLSEVFAVERFSFDVRTRGEPDEGELAFDGGGSDLARALCSVRDRYQGRPLAGILVITDGNPTDRAALDQIGNLPPVFPLVIAPEERLIDLSVATATASTNLFEDAPVMVDATLDARGMAGTTAVVTIHRQDGTMLEEKRQPVTADDEIWTVRFQVRPEAAGTAFFEVRAAMAEPGEREEATLENNRRLVAANRESGRYRVLYLGGRPNYEHKFLQRALEEDTEIQMTSLLRVARREPKFDYRSRAGERSNPLYRGFDQQEEVERFDEAVLIPIDADPGELQEGFPKTPEGLFPFDCVILDDIEAGFFDREQQRLLQRFVNERGGSLIMLGGMESLDAGGWADTPVGDMLPVYLDPPTPSDGPVAGRYQLTRDGRLEPWARLRADENAEERRIDGMPEFQNIHRLGGIRPGAMEIATFEGADGSSPALAVRRFGRGRTAALAVTDFWRWGMKDAEARQDLEKSWRQMLRWLLADVPLPLSITAESEGSRSRRITTELLGEDFRPDESGRTRVSVTRPDGTRAQIALRPHPTKAGVLQALHTAALPGAYLAEASSRATDDRPALSARTGWVVNALQDEFQASGPDMEAMAGLASSTGGRVLKPDGLDGFIAALKDIPMPVTETRSQPLWHSPIFLLAALACFIGEWALRRWKKLA